MKILLSVILLFFGLTLYSQNYYSRLNLSLEITNVTISNVDQETYDNICISYGLIVKRVYVNYFTSYERDITDKLINGLNFGYEYRFTDIDNLYVIPTIGIIKISDYPTNIRNYHSNLGFIINYYPLKHFGFGFGTNTFNKYLIVFSYRM